MGECQRCAELEARIAELEQTAEHWEMRAGAAEKRFGYPELYPDPSERAVFWELDAQKHANEAHRLRSAIEAAPHSRDCPWTEHNNRCLCWKREALGE